MTSYEMISKINQLTAALRRADALRAALDGLAENYSELVPELNGIFARGNNNDLWNYFNTLKARLDGIRAWCKGTIRPTRLFLEAQKLDEDMQAILDSFPGADKQPLKEFRSQLKDFWEKYEAFIKDYSHVEEVQMIMSAVALRTTFNSVQNMFTFVTDNLQREPLMLREDQSELSVYFEADVSVNDLATKLSAIQSLYEEACELLRVSVAQEPLEIVKVETGTAWLKFLGSKMAIDLVRRWIEAVAGYRYRNFTREGKISEMPREIEAVEGILQLRKELTKAGIDPTDMDEHIKKAATSVARNTSNLLAGQLSVQIDGETYSIDASSKQKLLGEHKQLLLNEATEAPIIESERQNLLPPSSDEKH